MKTKLLVLIAIYLLILIIPVGAQTKVTTPQPQKSAKMVYASKDDTIMIVPKETVKAQVLEVAQKDSTVKVQAKTIQTKDKTINNLKLQIPPKGSGFGAWAIYLIGLLSIVVVMAISYIPKLEKSNVPILQRLALEASSFVKRIQITCISMAGIITFIMSSFDLGDNLKTILGSVFIACSAIAVFAQTLVKDTSKLKTNDELSEYAMRKSKARTDAIIRYVQNNPTAYKTVVDAIEAYKTDPEFKKSIDFMIEQIMDGTIIINEQPK